MIKGKTIWLTGLPCSGKTTISDEMMRTSDTFAQLDGDDIRKLVKNNDMSPAGRKQHLSYIAMCCNFMNALGADVLCSFVSPTDDIRDEIARIIGRENMRVVWVKCSQEECISRDVKGMWALAASGKIKGFTGWDAPWEDPKDFDLCLDTEKLTLEECCEMICELQP